MIIWESKELLEVIALFIEPLQEQRAIDTAEDIALHQLIERRVRQKLNQQLKMKEQQHVQSNG